MAASELTSPAEGALGVRRVSLFAVAVGIVVLPLFATQPLIGVIGPDLGLSPSLSALTATVTLLGYAAGLFLLVPLTDLLENRRLILVVLWGDVLALVTLALAPYPGLFLLGAFLVGLVTSAIQMLVPIAAALSAEAIRGRTVGTVMSGLMLGILFSRPLASLVAEIWGWRSLYSLLAAAVAALTVTLAAFLPPLRPRGHGSYAGLIASLGSILREEPVLRRRAASQALCMGAFGVFWTSVALRLGQPPLSLGQVGIAVFALAGAAGAVIAPIAGRVGDRGLTRPGTRLAHAAVILAMALAGLGGGSLHDRGSALACLGGAAVLLDLGVIADQTLGRRAINLLRPEARGRLNGLFTGLFFLGSAAGSALSGFAWTAGGWGGVCAVGAAFGLGALAVALTDSRSRPEGAAA
ncbi:MAG: MFS transporter, partial [Actinomycetospora chiangmaiensis]|nr:MFS transporter [Actinomycetospora chiangmaiensis]